MRKKKLAFIFSGAAARIAQQAVLMRNLVEGKAFKDGKTLVPSVLAGASSGAISGVALNIILASEGLVDGGKLHDSFSWDEYEALLGSLTRKAVYKAGGILRSALEIMEEDAIFDTEPLRALLVDTLEKRCRLRTLGDLPIKTYISVVEQKTGRVHRLCSQDNPDLPLVDVIMASAAIPVIFPPVGLPLDGRNARVACVDGGTGPDVIPVDAIDSDRYDTVILIRHQLFDPNKEWFKSPPFSEVKIATNAINNFMYMQNALTDYAFRRAAWRDGSRVWCYFPNLEHNYWPLDFGSGKEQLEETRRWADMSDSRPRPVKDCI